MTEGVTHLAGNEGFCIDWNIYRVPQSAVEASCLALGLVLALGHELERGSAIG